MWIQGSIPEPGNLILVEVQKEESPPSLAYILHIYFISGNFRVLKFPFFFNNAIIIIIFARFMNSRICPPHEICEN